MTGSTPFSPLDQRVRRLSRLMVAACWALLVLLPLGLVGYWASASQAQLLAHTGVPPELVAAPLVAWQRLAGGAVTAVPLVLALCGVWQAKTCFADFARGQVFTARATRLLRRFAGWVAAAAGAALLAGTASSVILSLNNPPGARQLAIGIGSDHLFTLFFAGLVWLMAAVIGEGQALAEDNQGFV